MASNTYNLNTWSAKRILGDASITMNSNALLQLTNNDSWLLNSGRASPSLYGIKYVYDSTNGNDKIELYGRTSSDTATMWVQLNTGDIYIYGKSYLNDKVGIGYDPNTNNNLYKLYVNGDTYISGKTYFDDLVGIDYDPATSDNTYKLYVNGSSCYAGDIIPSITHTYSIGTSSLGWNNIYNQALSTRTIDAAPAADWSDSSIYIGYGAIEPTNVIRMYYSTDTSTRTEFFQINSDGSYALTRFGVNGQSTSYNLYVNGTAQITGALNTGSLNTGSNLVVRAANNVSEGGEIVLNPATSSYATIHIDSNQNEFRIHNGSLVRFTVNLSTGQVAVKVNTASTSKTTGALIVAGGVGVSGTVYANAVTATETISATDLHATSAITLYNTSADSPDIIWYYANKAKEQARIWMGSGGTATFAPYYRCYNSSGGLLFNGRLVIGHEGYTGDLNSLTNHIGLYYATTGSNHPNSLNYLGVIVIYNHQIAWTGNGLFYRTKNSSGTWQKWQKVTATATNT